MCVCVCVHVYVCVCARAPSNCGIITDTGIMIPVSYTDTATECGTCTASLSLKPEVWSGTARPHSAESSSESVVCRITLSLVRVSRVPLQYIASAMQSSCVRVVTFIPSFLHPFLPSFVPSHVCVVIVAVVCVCVCGGGGGGGGFCWFCCCSFFSVLVFIFSTAKGCQFSFIDFGGAAVPVCRSCLFWQMASPTAQLPNTWSLKQLQRLQP